MIEAKIEDLKADLELFEDELEKYEYIVSLGKAAAPLEGERKSDQFLIHGCQSLVWVIPRLEGDKIYFESDSNTVIVRGLAAMMCSLFSGESAHEVASFDECLLAPLGLDEIISPLRRSGVASMIQTMKTYAKEMA